MNHQEEVRQLGMAYYKLGLIIGLAGGFTIGCTFSFVLSVVLK